MNLDAWAKSDGAMILAESQGDYQGNALAEVASFAHDNPASHFIFAHVGATIGETYRMELRARLLRFHEPVVLKRSSDLAMLRSFLFTPE